MKIDVVDVVDGVYSTFTPTLYFIFYFFKEKVEISTSTPSTPSQHQGLSVFISQCEMQPPKIYKKKILKTDFLPDLGGC